MLAKTSLHFTSWKIVSIGLVQFFLWATNIGTMEARGSELQVVDYSLRVQEPLSPEMKKHLRPERNQIIKVYVEEGADVHAFDDRNVFPRLTQVSLAAKAEVNEKLLEVLARDYQSLDLLAIGQKSMLSKEFTFLVWTTNSQRTT